MNPPESSAPHCRKLAVTDSAFSDLDASELALWRRHDAPGEPPSNAFLSFGFTRAVHQVWGDVRVLVARHDGNTVALLPYHARRTIAHRLTSAGHRVGGILSDGFGLVAPPGAARLALEDVLAASPLNLVHFSHLLPRTASSLPLDARPCLAIDLAGGFDAYWRDLRERDRKFANDTARRESRFAERLGPISFSWHVSQPDELERIIDMKTAQYLRTGKSSHPMDDSRHRALLRCLAQGSADGNFAPVLSVLKAGDTWVASHFGLRLNETLHYWFPVYNPALSEHSPGRLLLMQVLRHAPAFGIARIDRGEGDQMAKRDFANSSYAARRGIWRRAGPRGLPAAALLSLAWRLRSDAVAT